MYKECSNSVFVEKNKDCSQNINTRKIFKPKAKHYRKENKSCCESRRFFKFFRFVFACVILTAFLVMFAWGESFFERNEKLQDFTCYDDFIWPVVMQDPLPFDEKTPPESLAVIRASIWNCATDNKNNENKFDENGMLVLSEDEVENNAKKLFGENISLGNRENFNGSFYKYIPSKKEFIVAPISGTDGYLPHTLKAFERNGDVFLNVGYVSPKNQFNSEMNKIEKDKFEKFAKYKLKKNAETGNFYISAVT
mgnify:FL=1